MGLIGIDREKADKLPPEVKEMLISGEVTPHVQVSITTKNGGVITLPLKLQMVADKEGHPALMAYPVSATLDEKRDNILKLTPEESNRLRNGDVIQKAIDINGEKTQQFLQLDPKQNPLSTNALPKSRLSKSSRIWKR